MVSAGCVWVCEVLISGTPRYKHGLNYISIEKPILLYSIQPGFQVPKVKHESMFDLLQEALYLNASLLDQHLSLLLSLGHLSLLHEQLA